VRSLSAVFQRPSSERTHESFDLRPLSSDHIRVHLRCGPVLLQQESGCNLPRSIQGGKTQMLAVLPSFPQPAFPETFPPAPLVGAPFSPLVARVQPQGSSTMPPSRCPSILRRLLPPRTASAASVRVEPVVRQCDTLARAPTSRPAIQNLLAPSDTPSACLHSENLPCHTPLVPAYYAL
jgi:hypothetical protein